MSKENTTESNADLINRLQTEITRNNNGQVSLDNTDDPLPISVLHYCPQTADTGVLVPPSIHDNVNQILLP